MLHLSASLSTSRSLSTTVRICLASCLQREVEAPKFFMLRIWPTLPPRRGIGIKPGALAPGTGRPNHPEAPKGRRQPPRIVLLARGPTSGILAPKIRNNDLGRDPVHGHHLRQPSLPHRVFDQKPRPVDRRRPPGATLRI